MSNALDASHVTAVVLGWFNMGDEPVDADFVIETVYACAFAHEARTLGRLTPAQRCLAMICIAEAARRHQMSPSTVVVGTNQHEDGIRGWFRERGEDLEAELARIQSDDRFQTVAKVAVLVMDSLRGLMDMLGDLQELQRSGDYFPAPPD